MSKTMIQEVWVDRPTLRGLNIIIHPGHVLTLRMFPPSPLRHTFMHHKSYPGTLQRLVGFG